MRADCLPLPAPLLHHNYYNQTHAMPTNRRVESKQGNESLLLDVTLCLWDSRLPADFYVAENGPSALATALAQGCEIAVPFLGQLLPMAVERGRRTYCHRPDCRYLATNNNNNGGAGWGGRDKDDPPLCSCAAGKVRV